MIRFISWAYSKLLGLFCFLIIVGCTVCGYFRAFAVSNFLVKIGIKEVPDEVVCGIIAAVLCLIISLIIVIIVFGFMAQVVAINRKLSHIEKSLDK